jgi:multicomponent Na+:H+ antiporter subunit C
VTYLPYLVAAWLFLIGLYGVITSRYLIHLIICVGVIQSSSHVLLLAISYRTGLPAPIIPTSLLAHLPSNRSSMP